MFERSRPVQDQRHGQSVLRLDSCIYKELLSISRRKVGISQRICDGRIEQHSWCTSVETAGLSDRLARFTREAQVLASLNHPNIAAIYGVEERALVMELVEGPALAERITTGSILLDEALPIDNGKKTWLP